MKLNLLTIVFLLLQFETLSAESKIDDFFRSTGKINTVLGVVVILFIVLFFYLIRLDKKISRLENQIKDE